MNILVNIQNTNQTTTIRFQRDNRRKLNTNFIGAYSIEGTFLKYTKLPKHAIRTEVVRKIDKRFNGIPKIFPKKMIIGTTIIPSKKE